MIIYNIIWLYLLLSEIEILTTAGLSPFRLRASCIVCMGDILVLKPRPSLSGPTKNDISQHVHSANAHHHGNNSLKPFKIC